METVTGSVLLLPRWISGTFSAGFSKPRERSVIEAYDYRTIFSLTSTLSWFSTPLGKGVVGWEVMSLHLISLFTSHKLGRVNPFEISLTFY